MGPARRLRRRFEPARRAAGAVLPPPRRPAAAWRVHPRCVTAGVQPAVLLGHSPALPQDGGLAGSSGRPAGRPDEPARPPTTGPAPGSCEAWSPVAGAAAWQAVWLRIRW